MLFIVENYRRHRQYHEQAHLEHHLAPLIVLHHEFLMFPKVSCPIGRGLLSKWSRLVCISSSVLALIIATH